MKGYSKIKENGPFTRKSISNKEFQFFDQDVDNRFPKPSSEQTQGDDHQPPPTIDNDEKNQKKIDFFMGKLQEEDGRDAGAGKKKMNGGEKNGGRILRRNFSVSSSTSYQKNKTNNNNNNINNNQKLVRQSSTRTIQWAMKRAFSMRRSSSVNSSADQKYCRIYDQPISFVNDDHIDDNCDNYDDSEKKYSGNGDDDGSMETTRCVSMKKKKDGHDNGKRNVGSKVVKACKRIFSR